MSRSLTVRKPRMAEVRRLYQLLEEESLTPQQHRRAEAVLSYAHGLDAIDIAASLGVHANTIYIDLHAFDQRGLKAVEQSRPRGAPAHLTPHKEAEICRLADRLPYEIGLPYGRWSLTKLRSYLIKSRLVKAISREHLRRVLKKGGLISAVCNVSSSAMTLKEGRFWPESAISGDIFPPTAYFCSLMSSRLSSKPMAEEDTPLPNVWCWSVGKRLVGSFIPSPFMM